MPFRISTLIVFALVAILSTACQCGEPAPGEAASIEISPRNLLLIGAGGTWQLQAVVRDAQGEVLDVPVTWEVDDPSVVSIDGSGVVTAKKIVGFSTVRAVAGDLRSGDGFVFPAILQPDTVVLSDAQIISGPAMVGPFSFGAGTRFSLEATGIDSTSVGDPIVAREDASVLGRITAVSGNTVEYELVPLPTVYRDLDVEVRRPLLPEASPAPGTQQQPLTANLGPVSCETGIGEVLPDVEFVAPMPDFKVEGGLVTERSRIESGVPLALEIGLEGRLVADAVVEMLLPQPFTAKVTCEFTEDIPIPVTGPLKDVIAPMVEIGLGIEIEGAVDGARLGLRGTLALDSGVIRTGVRYAPGRGFVAIKPNFSAASIEGSKVEVVTPDLSKMTVSATAYLYELSHMKVGSPWLTKQDIDFALEFTTTRAGMRHTIEAQMDPLSQLDDPSFATHYATEIVYEFGPGSYYDTFLWLVGLTSDDIMLEVSPEVAHSPLGTLTFSPEVALPDEPVTATVTMNSGMTFLGVDTLRSVHLFHDVGGAWEEMGPAEPGVAVATFTWTPTAADTGRHRFAAMMKTSLFPELIEIDPNSVRTLDVGDNVGLATLIFDAAGSPMNGGRGGQSLDINDAGMVSGYDINHNMWWVYRPGTGVELLVNGLGYLSDAGPSFFPPYADWMLPGDTSASLSASSRNGVFAGKSTGPGQQHAFLYMGSVSEILSAYTPSGEFWRIHAVDDSGVAVGTAVFGLDLAPAFLSGASPTPIPMVAPLNAGEVMLRTNGGLMAGVLFQSGLSQDLARTVIWDGTGPTVIDRAVLYVPLDIEDPDLIMGICDSPPSINFCFRMGRLGGTFVDLPRWVSTVSDTSGNVADFEIVRYIAMNASGTLIATAKSAGGTTREVAILIPPPVLP